MERFWNIREVSDFLQVKQSTIRSWIFQGRIPCVRMGRLVRFRMDEVEEWIEQEQKKIRKV